MATVDRHWLRRYRPWLLPKHDRYYRPGRPCELRKVLIEDMLLQALVLAIPALTVLIVWLFG